MRLARCSSDGELWVVMMGRLVDGTRYAFVRERREGEQSRVSEWRKSETTGKSAVVLQAVATGCTAGIALHMSLVTSR